jgi:hypothetical protein
MRTLRDQESVMPRITTFCVLSAALSALALSADSAGAETVHIQTVTPKIIVHTPTSTSTGSVTGGETGGTNLGAMTGRRRHNPLLIQKEKNAVPELLNAPVNSQVILPSSVTLPPSGK